MSQNVSVLQSIEERIEYNNVLHTMPIGMVHCVPYDVTLGVMYQKVL
jgi:hypothetical protein